VKKEPWEELADLVRGISRKSSPSQPVAQKPATSELVAKSKAVMAAIKVEAGRKVEPKPKESTRAQKPEPQQGDLITTGNLVEESQITLAAANKWIPNKRREHVDRQCLQIYRGPNWRGENIGEVLDDFPPPPEPQGPTTEEILSKSQAVMNVYHKVEEARNAEFEESRKKLKGLVPIMKGIMERDKSRALLEEHERKRRERAEKARWGQQG
jgi:hypothetical protein